MTNTWPDSNEFWHNKRVTPALHQTQCGASVVTGGNGFLGNPSTEFTLSVVEVLRTCPQSFDCAQEHERGAEVFVVDVDGYDPSATLRACLRRLDDIRRALSDAKPQMVIHPSTPLRPGSCGARGWHGIPLRFPFAEPKALSTLALLTLRVNYANVLRL